MFTRIVSAAALLMTSAILASAPARATDAKPWSIDLSAGVAYDDNVTLQALDLKSGIGDTVGNFGLSADYKLVDNRTNQLAVSYDFSQSLHAKLSNFDIQSHAIGLSGTTDIGNATLGLSYYFYHLLLGGSSFLDMQVVNPSVSTFLTSNLYLSASYFYYRKSFYTVAARDANHHEPHVTLFYFFNQAKSYVSFDAQYQIENTTGPQFDYKGYAFTLTAQHPVALGNTTVKLKASYSYLHRNYNNITPSIGVKRYENRSTLEASAEIPLMHHVKLEVNDRYMDRQSNLLSTNYTENVIGGMLHYSF